MGTAGCVHLSTTGLLDQTLLCCGVGGLSWALGEGSSSSLSHVLDASARSMTHVSTDMANVPGEGKVAPR